MKTPRSSSSPSARLASHFLLLLAATIKTHAMPLGNGAKPDLPADGSYHHTQLDASDQFLATKPNNYPHQQQQQQQFVKHLTSFMQVHKLSPTSNNVTCNDGSQVGYYMRLNNHSKSWVIYLQGGGFCGSEESCQQRWQRSPHLMSSHFWPKIKSVNGILSSEPKENPHLWNANHIYVPYCSSDSWTGFAYAGSSIEGAADGQGSSFAFMGSKIIERVLDSLYEDLPREFSLYEAKDILLAGDSAGATGVMLNLDKVNSILERRANLVRNNCPFAGDLIGCESRQPPVLRGLADSGWFLDNEPYQFELRNSAADYYQSQPPPLQPSSTQDASTAMATGVDDEPNCDRARCTPSQSIRQAMRLWNGQLAQACEQQYQSEPWRCYFGYRAYQTLKAPLFVVQWLYDEAQLMVDNIASQPNTSGQWNYVNKVANEMRTSLENVTALFAPSCFSHSLVTKRIWNQININGFKLPQALSNWEEQLLSDIPNSAIAFRQQQSKIDNTGIVRTISTTPMNSAHSDNPHHQHQVPIGFVQQIANASLAMQSYGANTQVPTFEALSMQDQEQLSSGGGSILAPIYLKDVERPRPFEFTQHEPVYQTSQRPAASAISARTRSRKRKRNNHHQRNNKRAKSALPLAQPTESSTSSTTERTSTVVTGTRDSNDVVSTSSANLPQELLLILDRSPNSDMLFTGSRVLSNGGLPPGNGRLGRSTIVDDSTLMLSNNVPDENPASQISPPTYEQHRDPQATRWPWPVELRSRQVTFGDALVAPIKTNNPPFNADRFRFIDSCGWPQCNRDCPTTDVSVLL